MKTRAFFSLLPGGVAAGLVAALVDAGVKSAILLLLACVAAAALRKSAAATASAQRRLSIPSLAVTSSNDPSPLLRSRYLRPPF